MRLSKFRPNRESNLELSTTSMIDVVFLLLIFFLVTTTFITPERQLKPNIRVQEDSSDSVSNDIEPVFIDILRQDGINVYKFGTTVTSNLDLITTILEKYPDKSGGAFVRLSNKCPFGMAASAIARCRRSGFQNVSLLPGDD